jgi:hypothetical protein
VVSTLVVSTLVVSTLVVSTLVVSTLWYLPPSNERRHPVRQNASLVPLLIKPVV